jgi:Asp-tRNA(Asn)/Glu-tRNA(Gln) amidotransferase A subunit family amidase
MIFHIRYTRQAISQFASATSNGMTIFVVPTAPTHPTISSVIADPIALNSLLGTFTHFGNVLDLCAVAIPAGSYSVSDLGGEGEGELPFSVTFLGAGNTDAEVLCLAGRFEEAMSRWAVGSKCRPALRT